MVEYFGQHLSGYLFSKNAWVQSYGTRCVKPPIIWSDIKRKEAITVAWSAYAQSQTKKLVKGMLTGPVTMLNWSFPREDISTEESTLQLALAIQEEVLDLEKHGIKIIQIDEAALREKLPLRKSDWYSDYLDWAIPAFRLVHSKVKPQTQIHTHMCYSEFTDIIPAIDAMDADVISFEASRSKLEILDALKTQHFETEVGPGVYDIHSPRVPSVSEIEATIKKILTKIPAQKVWINPDCGLKTRGVPETKASLDHIWSPPPRPCARASGALACIRPPCSPWRCSRPYGTLRPWEPSTTRSDGLQGVDPDFISVTFGHGAHRRPTRTITAQHRPYDSSRNTHIPAVAHLTASVCRCRQTIDECSSTLFEQAGVRPRCSRLRGNVLPRQANRLSACFELCERPGQLHTPA
jgi:methionine synthase II (cobalamin-independent)